MSNSPLFLITVDAEGEWDWSGSLPRAPLSLRNIREVPAFQALCAKLDVRPTWFVDYSVAEDEESTKILAYYLERGECDIGAHLHPWCTPPVEETLDERNSHAVNLPLDLFERKLARLTVRLKASFGCHPYSYRAGRWGVNGEHIAVLARAGYRVDSSVRPYYVEHDFSYAEARSRPYWPSFENVLAMDPAQRHILEVPVSAGYDDPDFERLDRLRAHLKRRPLTWLRATGIAWQTGLLRQVTLTPEGHSADDLCRCIDALVERGEPVINMYFHSSDLLPGATPYVRDTAELRRFIDCLTRVIEHAKSAHNAEFVTMREIRKRLTGKI